MPQKHTVTKITIFVASPSDVEDERSRVEQAVLKLNNAYKARDVQFDLVKWETHAYPGFASHPQEVINEQIPTDYDIFIGIMWCSVGTETCSASSGTIEEFERAKERYDSDPDSIRIMFYFKDAPPATLSDIDPHKLQRVKEFQTSLGKAGGLYWRFKTEEEFEKMVFLHLTLYISDLIKDDDKSSGVVPSVSIPQDDIDGPYTIHVVEDDEIGLLDLEEELSDSVVGLEKVSGRIASATEGIGEKLRTRTKEVKALQQNPKPDIRRKFKSIVNHAASDMNHYSARMDAEIPLFREHLDDAMTIFTRIVPLYSTFDGEDHDMMPKIKSAVEEFLSGLDSAEEGIEGFRDSVSDLPPMTRGLNRAKKKTIDVLQRIFDEIQGAKLKLGEIESFMN